MATYLDNLRSRRDSIAATLAAMDTKPDYSIDGESIQHSANRQNLLSELERINKILDNNEGPAIAYTRVR
jgi:hypothetical protein